MRPRVNFVELSVQKIQNTPAERINEALAAQFVQDFHAHFKTLHTIDAAKGRVRKLSHLSSVQTNLSRFKKILAARNLAPDKFLKHMHLSTRDCTALKREKLENKRSSSIHLVKFHAEPVIIHCIKLLSDRSCHVRCIALAFLTGRRTAELLYSMTFGPPTEKHSTDLRYWTNVTGICKQRHGDQEAVLSREIPLLVDRVTVLDSLKLIRKEMPCGSVQDANRYAKQLSRTMKSLPDIEGQPPNLFKIVRNIHNCRKFYASVCFEYFNEQNCSNARVAADYLGHKTMSDTVITYLSFLTQCDGSLNYRSANGPLLKVPI